MLRLGAIIILIMGFVTHDFHTSLTEVNYNSKSKALEISMRVFSDDLEKTLSKFNSNEKIKLEDDENKIDPLIEKYLRKNFALISPNKTVKLIKFYGKEQQADATWIYIEIADCEHINDFVLYNAVMQEMFADQTNLVNIVYPNKKKTLVFDAKTKTLPWPF